MIKKVSIFSILLLSVVNVYSMQDHMGYDQEKNNCTGSSYSSNKSQWAWYLDKARNDLAQEETQLNNLYNKKQKL